MPENFGLGLFRAWMTNIVKLGSSFYSISKKVRPAGLAQNPGQKPVLKNIEMWRSFKYELCTP
jgi:hypothetical protein